MNRVIRIDSADLDTALTLSAADRLRQANAAFRLFHELHQPYERPFLRGFAKLEEFFRFDEEEQRGR